MLSFQPQVSNKKLIITKSVEKQSCNFIKKRLQHWCFPVKFAKLLRRPLLKNYLRKTHCFSDLKHHIRVFHTLYFSSILRNSTENSEVSFYVSLGVLTTAPEGNCPPPLLRLGLLLGLGAIFLEGNYPRTVFPSVK